MNERQKEMQTYLKKIKPARREIELCKARRKTYDLIYDGVGEECERLQAELEAKQTKLVNYISTIQADINRLPDSAERSVLSLYYVDCLTMQEIADKLFYVENTVWKKHARALQHLADILAV